MNKHTCSLWISLCALLICPQAWGQKDGQAEIDDVTAQIQKNPTNAELYLLRGDLYRAEKRWDASQADYDFALSLNARIEAIDFVRGRLFLEAGWGRSAKQALDRFIAKQPNHLEALLARARCSLLLSNTNAALADFARAMEVSPDGSPELYIQQAQLLAAQGGAGVGEAAQMLEDGLKKLGPVPSLQLAVIDLELAQKKYDSALARIDAISASVPRKETWLAKKGEILLATGKPAEARVAWQSALREIEKLPPARKNVPAVQDLQRRLQQQLQSP